MAEAFGFRHEVVFNAYNTKCPDNPGNEVSWMAQPFHRTLVSGGTKVIHLVRHPLGIINSHIGADFWLKPSEMKWEAGASDARKPYRDFILKNLPELISLDNPIDKSMAYYVLWNRPLLENKIPRIRIEDIINAPVLNKGIRCKLQWADLKGHEFYDQLNDMAKEFYYV